MEKLEDSLLKKLKTLNETIWEGKVSKPIIDAWLENFTKNEEHLLALFILRHMMYFGKREIDELLKAVFRDLYKYPIIEKIRKNSSDTTDIVFINSEFNAELNKTRFVALGNISESSTHLFYNFRQINNLRKGLFISSDQIFEKKSKHDKDEKLLPRLANVRRFVFFDDLCGSGSQAVMYSETIVKRLKKLNSDIKVLYFSLLATSYGLSNIKKNAQYDQVECIFELDETFRCFDRNSRYFIDERIDKDLTRQMCEDYGNKIEPSQPLGHDDSQLLLAFHHNTPDNCLPIIWSEEKGWEPIFKRFEKIYG